MDELMSIASEEGNEVNTALESTHPGPFGTAEAYSNLEHEGGAPPVKRRWSWRSSPPHGVGRS